MIYVVGNPYMPMVLTVAHRLDSSFDIPVRAIWTEDAHYELLPEDVREDAMHFGGEPPLPPMVKVRVGTVQEVVAWIAGDVGTNNVAFVHIDLADPPKPYQVTGLGLFDAVVVSSEAEAEALVAAGYMQPVSIDLFEAVRKFLVRETAVRVIIPIRNRDVGMTRKLVESVKAQMKLCDEVVISDLGSSKNTLWKLHHLATSTGTTLVHEKSQGWNMSRARNNGVKAPGLRFDVVAPLDADLVIPDGYIEEVRKATDHVLVPYCETPGGFRIAAGAAAMPREWVVAARGWDEEYEGYGSEDIDMTFRLGEAHAAPGSVVYKLRQDIMLKHHDHEPCKGREEYGQKNMQRVNARFQGELSEVNPQGWGEGATCYVERGRTHIAMRYHHVGHAYPNPSDQVPPPNIGKPPEGFGF
jgi:hypothetical protein